MDVLVLAGRPVLLEPLIFGILERQGAWDSSPLVRSICAGQVPLLVLNGPLSSAADYAPYGVPWWPEPVIRALQARMQPAGEMAGRLLYQPAPDSVRPALATPICRGAA
jgi:hypothetical protein